MEGQNRTERQEVTERKIVVSSKETLKSFFRICLTGIFQFLSLPARVLRAIFYVPVNVEEESGSFSVQRGFFSITRALFVFGAVVGLGRLFVGGTEITSLSLGPQYEVLEKERVTETKTSSTKTRTPQIHAQKRRGRQNRSIQGSNLKHISNRPKKAFFELRGYKAQPLSTTELCFVLMLGCFYFFRKHLQRGDTTGEDSWLSKFVVAGLAYKGLSLQPLQANSSNFPTTNFVGNEQKIPISGSEQTSGNPLTAEQNKSSPDETKMDFGGGQRGIG